MDRPDETPLVATTRRDALKYSGVAAVGAAAAMFKVNAEPLKGAAPVFQRLQPDPLASQFNVVEYGADATGNSDSSAAVRAAVSALKQNGGGTLLFPAGGTYVFGPGIVTRRTLADCLFALTALGATLRHNGVAGALLDTQMTDPAYWAVQPTVPMLAPWQGSLVDGINAPAGSVGIQHSIGLNAYYDFFVQNYVAGPTSNWPTSGSDGCRGWRIFNQKDDDGVGRWTERTTFGPWSGQGSNYIGIEFDAASGINSFGYTTMTRFIHSTSTPGQRAMVVRGSEGTLALLYNSLLNCIGNVGNNTVSGQELVGTFSGTAVIGQGYVSLAFASGLTVAVYDGQIVIVKDASGLNPQAVMVRGNNPVGSSTLDVYGFTAAATFTGGTVEVVAAGIVVGWSGTGSSNDVSRIENSSVTWTFECNGPTLSVAECPLFVSSNAHCAFRGVVDFTLFGEGLIQAYGTLQADGVLQGEATFSHLLNMSGNAVTNAANGQVASDLATLGQVPGTWRVAHQSLVAATVSPESVVGFFSGFTAGTVFLYGVDLTSESSISTVLCDVNSSDVGTGVSGAYVGLYNQAGILLGSSADLSSAGQLGPGIVSAVLTASSPGTLSNLPAGVYYVGLLLASLTTSPSLSSANTISGGLTNANATFASGSLVGGWRIATAGSQLSSLPQSMSALTPTTSGTGGAIVQFLLH